MSTFGTNEIAEGKRAMYFLAHDQNDESTAAGNMQLPTANSYLQSASEGLTYSSGPIIRDNKRINALPMISLRPTVSKPKANCFISVLYFQSDSRLQRLQK